MKRLLSARALALGLALTSALLLVAVAQAGGSSHSRTGALVALKKTPLGTILVDARGRTLYLFEKDRGGVSTCDGACAKNWPPLTSLATPRAGKGIRPALLKLARSPHGTRQVTYAGHPLYRFVGDKRAGQTAGEGLEAFGAEWYALAADGQKIDKDVSGSDGKSDNSSSSGGYGGW